MRQLGYLLALQESSLLETHLMSQRRTPGKPTENGRMSTVCLCAIPWFCFSSWSQTMWLGDVIHLSAFGQHMIILNSAQAAWDLLEKRSSIYSDRNHMTMLLDLWVNSLRAIVIYVIILKLLRMGNGWNFSLMHYGDLWRAHRKLFHQEFNSGAVSAYHDVQLKYARWDFTDLYAMKFRI